MKDKYHVLFDRAPVAIIEMDYRPLLALKDAIPSKSAAAIRSFLLDNPKKLKAAFQSVKVLNVNKGALDFYKVKSKEDFFTCLTSSLTGMASDALVEQCVNLLAGEDEFSGETKYKIGSGQIRDVFLKTVFYSTGRSKDKTLVVMTLQDITPWKKIERYLLKKAQKDGLTNLLNQGALLNRLEHELIRAKRYGLELACMMIDLDFFKVINDKFGHQKGDLILKEVAGMIRKCFRDVDVVGRYGGDEFMVILPETSVKLAYYPAQRLQTAFAEKLFKYKNVITFHITLSIGIAGYASQKKIKNAQDMIALADNEMYNCKRSGRNRISMAQP